jgi:hypothetical protein
VLLVFHTPVLNSIANHLNIHRTNCRRAGGSIGSIVYTFDEADVKISDPNDNMKSYKDNDTKSGNPIARQFCGNCGW